MWHVFSYPSTTVGLKNLSHGVTACPFHCSHGLLFDMTLSLSWPPTSSPIIMFPWIWFKALSSWPSLKSLSVMVILVTGFPLQPLIAIKWILFSSLMMPVYLTAIYLHSRISSFQLASIFTCHAESSNLSSPRLDFLWHPHPNQCFSALQVNKRRKKTLQQHACYQVTWPTAQ